MSRYIERNRDTELLVRKRQEKIDCHLCYLLLSSVASVPLWNTSRVSELLLVRLEALPSFKSIVLKDFSCIVRHQRITRTRVKLTLGRGITPASVAVTRRRDLEGFFKLPEELRGRTVAQV